MAAIKQHAIVEKRASEGIFYHLLFSLFMFGLNLSYMMMAHLYCEMQNKLSNTRGLPLGSMG